MYFQGTFKNRAYLPYFQYVRYCRTAVFIDSLQACIDAYRASMFKVDRVKGKRGTNSCLIYLDKQVNGRISVRAYRACLFVKGKEGQTMFDLPGQTIEVW